MCQGSTDTMYTLEYEFKGEERKFNGFVNGRRTKHSKINIFSQVVEKQIVIFEIPLKILSLDYFQLFFYTELKQNEKSLDRNTYFPRNTKNQLSLFKKTKDSQCYIEYCNIGLLFYKDNSSPGLVLKNLQDVDEIFYYGFVKSSDNNKFILSVVEHRLQFYIFNFFRCPTNTWISNFSLTKYIPDTNDIIDFSRRVKVIPFFFKVGQRREIDSEEFIKCGHLEQFSLPSIDVGYIQKKRKFYEWEKYPISYADMSEPLNYKFMVEDENYLHPNKTTLFVLLSKYNYKTNLTTVNVRDYDSKFYSGQHLLRPLDTSQITYFTKSGYLGFYDEWWFNRYLPEIDATLRLKINGIVQEYEEKINDKFGKIVTYVVNRKEINSALVGCHAVPDEFKQPVFEDFYEYRYKTALMMFDKKTGDYTKEVSDIQSLESDNTYMCVLAKHGTNSRAIKTNYIKETTFTIELDDPWFNIWIIFGIFIAVTLLLIAGLVIFKRIQLKKKKSNNSLSTSISNSSQSSTVSSTVKTDSLHVPIIQSKLVKAETKNNTSNIATKKSNNYNQLKNTPKKSFAKISNQNLNKKVGDSVFQLK